tara:strand:+ start:3284 stop:3613 length:330 start_codon:yes stop_codon:yes gene_type:complete
MAKNDLPTDLSPEEMAKRRAEITAYYEENIPSLKIQLEYETILRDIEKMRAERLQAQKFIAQSMAPTPEIPEVAKAPSKNTGTVEAAKEFEAAKRKAVKTLKRTEDAVK